MIFPLFYSPKHRSQVGPKLENLPKRIARLACLYLQKKKKKFMSRVRFFGMIRISVFRINDTEIHSNHGSSRKPKSPLFARICRCMGDFGQFIPVCGSAREVGHLVQHIWWIAALFVWRAGKAKVHHGTVARISTNCTRFSKQLLQEEFMRIRNRI